MSSSGFPLFLVWSLAITVSNAFTPEEVFLCGHQLGNYKHFIINLLLNMDDTCDHLKYLGSAQSEPGEDHRHSFKDKSHEDVFSQIIKFAYEDVSFYVMLQNAVFDKCQQELMISSLVQERPAQKKNVVVDKPNEASNEKRNSVIIGKKQRFNPWGGKRSLASTKILWPDGRLPGLSDTYLY